MKQVVFYSWQSDLPNASNRGFIHEALEAAAATIAADASLAVEPVVDRDTQGVPGSPDIASTIFAKITSADVFVADVSIVARGPRPTPNPNVLIELGYALKALGHENVVLVFNRAFGKIEELPFDLRARRVLSYDVAAGEAKAPGRKLLEKQLEQAVRTALQHRHKESEPASIPAVEAIEEQKPNRTLVLRRNLDDILRQLDALQPKLARDGGTVDELSQAIEQSQEVVAEFSKIATVIAVMNQTDLAMDVHRWFGQVFERYDLPRGFSGSFNSADQDFFKFVGHEMFVTMVAALLREQRWEILGRVLREPIPMRYVRRNDGPGNVFWDCASEHLPSVLDEGHRRQRLCLHSDLLNTRHTTGGLAAIMPMDDFAAADYFLFLYGEMTSASQSTLVEWRPWGALYLKGTPQFLLAAESKEVAASLLKLFNINDSEEFKQRFQERAGRLHNLFRGGFWRNPVPLNAVEYFGTR